jgi:hypothetical protein
MARNLFVLTAFVFVSVTTSITGYAEVDTFSESVLIDAFEDGCSLVIAEILSVSKNGRMYYYRVRIKQPIVAGDLTEDEVQYSLDLFAGASYGNALKQGSIYALFIVKECPYHYSWAFREDVIRIDISNEKAIQDLIETAKSAYSKTSICQSRKARVQEDVELPALPEKMFALCQDFKNKPENRAETGKRIFESDLGSRVDDSKPFSSEILFLPPKICLSRSQMLLLLGEPTIRSGWVYSWLCGQGAERGWVGRDVYVLSATFNEDENVVRLLYQQQKKSKWTKIERCVNELYGLAGQPESVFLRFQRALQREDWPEVLSYCTEKIRKKAQEYDSEKEFFYKFMPVEKIAGLSEFPVRGYSSRGEKIQSISLEVQLDVPHEQWPVKWEWSLFKQKDRWTFEFKLLPVDMLIRKELARRQLEDEDNRTRIEKIKKGIEIRLIPISDEFVIGQTMLFRIEMINVKDTPILYTATGPHSVTVNDPMLIVDSSGKTLEYVDTSYQTGVWSDAILPGETIVLVDKYDVTSQYRIMEPGIYRFQFRGWPRDVKPSNICEIEVKPNELPVFELIVEKLLLVLPKGWTLERRLVPKSEYDEGFCAAHLFIHLIGQREGGKGGDKGVFLLILMNGGSALEEPWLEEIRERFDFWGLSKWGHVYATINEAEQLWPDYKEQIIKVLEIIESH